MEDILAIILIFGGGIAVAISFSPIGRAIGERIRGRASGADGLREEVAEHREAMTEELQTLRQEVSELAERLDFAERLLAKGRDTQGVGRGQ
jgi:hypothetical protein